MLSFLLSLTLAIEAIEAHQIRQVFGRDLELIDMKDISVSDKVDGIILP